MGERYKEDINCYVGNVSGIKTDMFGVQLDYISRGEVFMTIY